jgi:hypothetical protein
VPNGVPTGGDRDAIDLHPWDVARAGRGGPNCPRLVATASAVASEARAESELSSLTIAYQAIEFDRVTWYSSDNLLYEILGAFGIGKAADDGTIELKSVTTTPNGARIGWSDGFRLGAHEARTANDDLFYWLGTTPLSKCRLGTGRIYIRVVPRAGSVTTTTYDLTVSRAGTDLSV